MQDMNKQVEEGMKLQAQQITPKPQNPMRRNVWFMLLDVDI